MPSPAPLEDVAQFGPYQPIGVAVTGTGRIFVTFPRRQPYRYGVAEVLPGNTLKPYPDAAWNAWDSSRPTDRFVNAQAAVTDDRGFLWILDPANPDDGPTIPAGVKLLQVSLQTNAVERVYRFEDLPREQTALNDVRIDHRHGKAYLSDPKLSAIVVLDLQSGRSRLALRKHPSTQADPDFRLHLDGKDVVDGDGKPFSSNINGIALSPDGRYFYYRAINQTRLYRIATEALAAAALDDSALARRVETVGETSVSHGMLCDANGNVFLSDSPEKAIRYVTPDGRLETLVRDARLIWPDTYAIGPDGYLYVTASQMNRLPKYNDGINKAELPYRLYKVKLP